MAQFLDLQGWPRRAAFDYFRAFDKPYFNVCTRLDAAPLKAALPGGGFAAACWFATLKLANTIEPFRYRLDQGRVRVLDVVHGATTVLRPDESFSFAYLDWADAGFAAFRAHADARVRAARDGADFEPRVDDGALVHFTTLPWVHFTSFSHARNWGREDSVPKIAFGRLQAEGPHLWLPFSLEVHHALMDGLHLGRYVQALEALLADPAWVHT